MSPLIFILLQSAVVAYALVGGVFLAFSDFIMRSLALSGGAAAMQAINREVFRWIFMALFLGMAAMSVIIAALAGYSLSGPASGAIIIAALIYLFGCFAVTVFCNVPMNEALAAMDPDDQATNDFWSETYLPRWTFWNTIRTIACVVSAGLMLFALSQVETA